MNRIISSLCLYFSMTYMVLAQNYVKHVVIKGETITQIAGKYKVTPYDIYKLNPDSQSGIKESDVILIPSSVPVKETASQTPSQNGGKTHIAKPKETLYSISRDYNVNVDELKRINPEVVKDGLKIGQTIKIPSERMSPSDVPPPIIPEKNKFTKAVATSDSAVPTKSDNPVYHIVEAKETKFGIAKKYGMTVDALEKKNPAIVSGLPVGYKLVISGNAASSEPPVVEKPKPVKYETPTQTSTQTTTTTSTKFNGFANYEVKPKETLFSLAQMFDVTQEELIMLNPTLKDGVKTGMILKVPGRGSMTMVSGSVARSVDLTKTIKPGSKKQLALLLPFNAAKIHGDTMKSVAERLKKDAFLNMTLDFYSGALMAIDSAKTLGMNIDVKIYDSEESKMSSNVAQIVQKNNLENSDAVVGPFYQQYVEKVAEILNSKNIPVISPLSKETGKTYSNLFQAMPPADYTKSAILDFMVSKQGNIIVVSDSKRVANKEFITKNYPTAKFNALTENGGLDTENLKSLLVKDKINYVVMDSEKTGMILGTTTVLLNEMANFQIQLAIIEPNETLDFEEISMKRLTILKMLYPSLTNDRNTPDTMAFENAYKRKNKIFPSQYAVRGFDVTFDTMLRLSQGKSFNDSANDDKTEQVESMFEYAKKDTEGYVNKGIYILEYQDDLSVKQVN